MKNYNLERFKSAQTYDYEKALCEIRNGRKKSHWMWYIFPQIRELGHSRMAKYYGISSIDEAKAYLSDPILGYRLTEICEALLDLKDKDAEKIFGLTDCRKLKSCMSLFDLAGNGNQVFSKVLQEYYNGERDEQTVKMITNVMEWQA